MSYLYSRGVFTPGQLMESKANARSQDIYWFDSNDERVSDAVTVRLLVSMIDSIIAHFNGHVPYKICGRSRAMLAIYPSNGTHYVKHVDNPIKDGRCITSIYYCNQNWNAKKEGGCFRLFPDTSDVPLDIEPRGDRLLFLWSDRRNPHEVRPVFRDRYAVTVWYFDTDEKLAALARRRKQDEFEETKKHMQHLRSVLFDNEETSQLQLPPFKDCEKLESNELSSLDNIPVQSDIFHPAVSLLQNNRYEPVLKQNRPVNVETVSCCCFKSVSLPRSLIKLRWSLIR
ncbi:unnamed protein product [Gongylonema pulchrum]|uniref:hypoxia-inducible factor-proline dioxygenase n=1 Tax=Gongylonema pulchrum TaxID=637853 RepID=A0A183DN40_9BILA|nr:unnamed protein product [Gongylonema pulchrum]